MKKQWLTLLFAVCFAGCAFAQDSAPAHALLPFGKQAPKNEALTINYNGGPIFETAPTVYIVYYGKWTKKDHTVIDGFFMHLGGTTMDKINTTYSDSSNKFEKNAVNYDPTKDSYNDKYSLGHSLSGDTSIHTIVRNAIKGGHLPSDTNGIYFVMTGQDVSFPGMCTQLCGYHSPATDIVTGKVIKYSMVGNPAQCPNNCEASAVIGDGTKSPNNDPGADGVVNIAWHEFSESTSDPEVNMQTAWAGNCGENGDCCAWQFGTLHTASNGSHYNEKFHGKEYITQMMLELTSKSRNGAVPGVCKNTF